MMAAAMGTESVTSILICNKHVVAKNGAYVVPYVTVVNAPEEPLDTRMG